MEAHRAGNLGEAESICRTIVAKQPASVGALNLLGMIAGQRGDTEDSAKYFRRALAFAPHDAFILANLGGTLRQQRRLEEAEPLLRRAVSIAPSFAEGHLKLAVTLIDMHRSDEALAACRAGLLYQPGDPHLNGLAATLLIERQSSDAVPYLFAALKQAPHIDRHWQQLAQLLAYAPLPPTPETREWLMRAVCHPVIRLSDVAGPIARVAMMDPKIAGWARQAEQGSFPQGPAFLSILPRLAGDRLLMTLMVNTVIPSISLERLFTAVRRELLLGGEPDRLAPHLPLMATLAIQAFLTDYAWAVSEAEKAACENLMADLHSGETLAVRIALVAAYRPLYGLNEAQHLLQLRLPDSLTDLVRIQVREPEEERALRAQIPALTPIANPVSREVREQYEEHPYPRWVRAGRLPAVSLPQFISQLGGQAPSDVSFSSPDVLIAGCGTGQHPLSAASFYTNAKILAIDLSLASLGYATRKSRELGVDNIEYRQADILELGSIPTRFHVVESAGVLHHLADPLSGWRILVDLLRPSGLMNIALYSEAARQVVVEARDYIARRGYRPDADDMRRFRQDVLSRPDNDSLARLRGFTDLFNISECRDLLFHVQEHRFTLPQIKQAIADLGLRFLGFRYPLCAAEYRQRFPDDPRMLSLDNWDTFEQAKPDLFAGMYNFWVQKT